MPQIKADPAAGTAMNIGGTVNVLDAAKTRGHPGRVRELGSRLLAVDDTGGAGAERRGRPSDDLLRRAQAGVRGHGADLLGGGAGAVDRHPAVHRLRARARHRPDRLAEPRDGRRGPGEDSRIAFGGRTQLQYAPDTARVFVAAARAATEGARVFNLGGPAVTLADAAQADRETANGTCRSTSEHGCRSRTSSTRCPRRCPRSDQLDAARGRGSRDDRPLARRLTWFRSLNQVAEFRRSWRFRANSRSWLKSKPGSEARASSRNTSSPLTHDPSRASGAHRAGSSHRGFRAPGCDVHSPRTRRKS